MDVSVIHRHDARSGIQRVVRALLLQLMANPIPGYELRPVFATISRGYCYARPDFLNGRSAEEEAGTAPGAVLVEAGAGDIFLGLDLAANLLPRYQHQIRCWKDHGASVHILVYDLLPLVQGKWFHRRTRRHFARWLRFIARYADGAICISEQVRKDFQESLARRHPRASGAIQIRKIRLSGDVRGSGPSLGIPEEAAALCRYLQSGPMVLMVGTVEPRKGYDKALAAFEELWRADPRSNHRLVIVGRPGWKTARLQHLLRNHPEAGGRLFWLSDASDEFVEMLYQLSTGVLVTSHAEGYGLPLIEACTHGKPVLARSLAVFHEFEHPGIGFFEDDGPIALSRAIRVWIDQSPRLVPLPAVQSLPEWSTVRKELVAALGLGLTLPPQEPSYGSVRAVHG